MPKKLTAQEARHTVPGLRKGRFAEYTFLTAEERAELEAGDGTAERRAELNARAQAARQERTAARQAVSPANPYGAPLDSRTNLPEYPRVTHNVEKRLAEAVSEYSAMGDLLTQRLDDVAAEFEEAFAADDRRRATLERIQRTGAPDMVRNHRDRMNRIG